MNLLTLKALSLPEPEELPVKQIEEKDALPTNFRGKKFLKGPISWDWICRAARLRGRSLHVAMGIWHLAGITRGRTMKLSQKVLRELGLNRNAAYRGLAELEKDGLVRVRRRTGQNSEVTIIDVQ